jgi:hypothetical protein
MSVDDSQAYLRGFQPSVFRAAEPGPKPTLGDRDSLEELVQIHLGIAD